MNWRRNSFQNRKIGEVEMTVTSKQLKDMTIAISLGLDKADCATRVNTKELEEMWEELTLELEEITAKGWQVEIPWDPFD